MYTLRWVFFDTYTGWLKKNAYFSNNYNFVFNIKKLCQHGKNAMLNVPLPHGNWTDPSALFSGGVGRSLTFTLPTATHFAPPCILWIQQGSGGDFGKLEHEDGSSMFFRNVGNYFLVIAKPLTPELNPSAQRCLTRIFTRDFFSWTVHFVNICADLLVLLSWLQKCFLKMTCISRNM
jgi:hypothetical protein